MWLIQGRYDVSVGELEPYSPYEIKAIHAKHFLRLGKGVGYMFPKHQKRESTAHFLLTKRNFQSWHFKADVPNAPRPEKRETNKDTKTPTLSIQELIEKIFLESI